MSLYSVLWSSNYSQPIIESFSFHFFSENNLFLGYMFHAIKEFNYIFKFKHHKNI